MSIIDDPVLALIARFITDDLDNLSISDENFLKTQIDTIYSHIKDAPQEAQQKMALEWIREHAENYRGHWQKKSLSRCITNRRCNDCPLIHGSNQHCIIHSQWVILLNDYLADKIDSAQYVEKTLNILQHHKDELKVSRVLPKVHNA